MTALPAIKITRSICSAYGHCWSANNPYYSGHYRTKKAAARAAAQKRKQQLRHPVRK